MTKKQILLAGMRHHDFEPEIPDIYERIIGERVLLQREDDNAWDKGMAVAAYYEGQLLAYVHGDNNKLIIRNAITLSGREPYPGVVKRFRKARNEHESDMLVADITLPDGAETSINLKVENDPTDWSNWTWTAGDPLPRTKEQNQLCTISDDLVWLLKDGEPWSKYYEEDIKSISENAWADISGDQQEKIREIVAALVFQTDERMDEAAFGLQQVMCHLGSPEVRQRVFNQLRERAEDPKVIAYVKEKGYTTQGLIESFPPGMYQLLTGDPETFVGRTSYLKMPREVLNRMFSGVTYLLCRFMLDANEKLQFGVPLEERVISVSDLLKYVDQCKGTDLALHLIQIIMLSSPGLKQEDLDLLRSKLGQEPIQGQVFKECTFTGNNIIESIQNASKMPALPKTDRTILLPEK